ncbi:glycosyltransferase family 2 protein [Comamonas sp. Tr-654]|uniref:glycosyltransferase family 2 protein n=1 Tax=Comamonas sp. Tr-654 TaxID=2608341 RepID=UPI0014249765|nr:glycosyltransferase family 2 protein [Comamonas sp. Tr-654]NIF83324.1 glycosyltransferase family 2 protein [Comamonas sp. Tr-654]
MSFDNISRPLVSVITPAFNSENYINEAIDSVLSQTYKEIELIVVDDCSSDRTQSIVEEYIRLDDRVKYIRMQSNCGVAEARNNGIRLARGRFIAFLDSDDIWYPEKIERQVKFMQEKSVSLTFCAYEKINEHGVVFGEVSVPAKVGYSQLLKTCVIGCLTAMYDVNKLGKVYMPLNTRREDFATWLSILKKIDYAFGSQEVLAKYRVYSLQSSSKKMKMAAENWNLYRNIEKLGFLKSAYYFSHYAVKGLCRTRFPKLAKFMGFLD